ncbi:MAG: hypothetical protein IKC26_08310 [Clostridia bacterium]|nr:hypothetical protein [Clostridia bacterium]
MRETESFPFLISELSRYTSFTFQASEPEVCRSFLKKRRGRKNAYALLRKAMTAGKESFFRALSADSLCFRPLPQ